MSTPPDELGVEIQHPLEQPEADRAPELDPAELPELPADAELPADEPVDRPPDVFVLVSKDGELDVLHRNPGEQCNTDDASHRQTVDAATADAVLAHQSARECEHCYLQEG